MTDADQPLVNTLADLADTLVSDFDIAELFYRLVESCVSLVDADEAGLLLMDRHGELGIAAATSDSTHLVELLQVQAKDGPCFDAFRLGEAVRSGPLGGQEAERKWPEFAPLATSAGFDSVVAVPMRLRAKVIGSLNLFRIRPGEATDRDIMIAQALADLATIAIIQGRVVGGARETIDQLQNALDTRVSIEQAKGIVAERTKLDLASAFERIRAYARSSNLRLSDVSAQIISGELDTGLSSGGDPASPDTTG
jgi:GAF domain-containing protein